MLFISGWGDGDSYFPHPGNEKHIQIKKRLKLFILILFFFQIPKRVPNLFLEFSRQINRFKTLSNGNRYLLFFYFDFYILYDNDIFIYILYDNDIFKSIV